MHIERIHKMIEKLTECALCEIEKGIECVNTEEMGEVIDMIKDLSEAEYKSLISKEMKQYKEEEEAEEKYMMKMLKEDRADEYKRMKDEYGDEEGERRFYDNYRHANGRFAPKGRGSYMPRSSGRRGYVEPPYYHMMPDMYDDYNAEEMRDLDRKTMNRMYYTPMSGNSGNMGGSSTNSSGGNMGENARSYSDGYNDGNRRGYEEGYEQGSRDGRRNGNNSQSRSDRMRRNYTENKHMNDNSPEGKKKNMENLDSYMKELAGEMTELVEDMDASEKNMVRSKLQTLANKIQ